MGRAAPFRIEEISRYDERGAGWYWNNFSFGEHTGTHFDAPIHWVSGRDLPEQLRPTRSRSATSSRPPCVIDCSQESAADADFLLTRGIHRRRGRSSTARIPPRSLGVDADRLVEEDRSGGLSELRRDRPAHARPRSGCGAFPARTSATCSASAPRRSAPMPARPRISCRPIPCHYYMHGAGRYGLQCLTNLDLLPPTGAVADRAAAEDPQGSGSPLRVLALVPSSAAGAGRS